MCQTIPADALLDGVLYRYLPRGLVSKNLFGVEEIPRHQTGGEMTPPRPNMKLVHPLDRYQYARYERRMRPRPEIRRMNWLTLTWWSLGIGLALACWYGVLLLLWWCCI